ncbi:aminotransferase family protein [Streptomyces antimicrobicus]|uniref:Aminotransferase class III-fold pyridoxal phosphate-dependent enzyme n=1 Tax=Streptomyces antimicrobicus TaxID=2883108 RepID=A0ABS8B0U8_9ACTN|nr:aminotransferase class III-fold pyridoxal phosphate-dependent enzyme [Streptomyces antimicrobicus]MCB5178245.1 aminotransferase class III-fold pyridoxal phosphate-dependent enzyme [Streptomyces antimicrobicus]
MSQTIGHTDATENDAARVRDSKYVWHPWSRNEVERDRLMIVRGEGSRVWDAAGREYIDASSLNSTVGYGNEDVIAAATEQLRTLHGVDMSATNHPVAGRLAEVLAGYLPESLSRTLLLNSGSEGIEAALMIASCYRRITGDPRNRVITFAQGYHGSTVLTRTLSGLVPTGHPFQQPIEVTRVTLPLPAAELRTPEAAKVLAAAFAEALADGDAPLAVVVEPFLNVGGGIVLPPGFLTELRALCDDAGALLIFDEIFTGYGRTGKMFAFQHEGAAPDILVSSKGLGGGYAPISAVTARQDIYAAFADDEIIGGLRYGHTTAGHATACAVAIATLGVMERERLVENAEERGRELLKLIEPLRTLPGVVDTRGLGLVGVVETADMATAAALVVSCQEHGLMVRQQAASVLVCPPLTLTSAEVEEIAERITTATRALASEQSTEQSI